MQGPSETLNPLHVRQPRNLMIRANSMRDLEIRCWPAECSARHCNDNDCPYTHHDMWEFDGDYYLSEDDAKAALAALALSSHQDK